MHWLVDTNVLLRQVQPDHPAYQTALAAIAELRRTGESLYVGVQNLAEFRCVATRPVNVNGLGMSPRDADAELDRIEALFPLAPDDPGVYPIWRHLVSAHAVSGVQIHDARLVAAMHVHRLTHLLTFNTADFERYPDITPVHPQDVAGAP